MAKSEFRQCFSGRLGTGDVFLQFNKKDGKRNVANGFFEPGGILKRWDGTQWVRAKLKTYSAAFGQKRLRVYKNGAFIGVDSNGL